MSVKDADGIIVLGNDSVTPANNITIKTPAVADGSVEIYRGVPGNLGQKLFAFDSSDTDFNAKLAAAFGGANQGLAANGYQILPGGLIIQWGSRVIVGLTDVIVTFPIAFPNAALNIGATLDLGASGGAVGAAHVFGATQTTIKINQTVSGQNLLVWWFATGH